MADLIFVAANTKSSAMDCHAPPLADLSCNFAHKGGCIDLVNHKSGLRFTPNSALFALRFGCIQPCTLLFVSSSLPLFVDDKKRYAF